MGTKTAAAIYVALNPDFAVMSNANCTGNDKEDIPKLTVRSYRTNFEYAIVYRRKDRSHVAQGLV